MSKGRLETFSDGVIAILITIMVLELHIPAGTSWRALGHELPAILAYVLSFVYLGIYWNNHHHMLAAVSRVSGAVAVGQPPSAVLALARPVQYRLDERAPVSVDSDRDLRGRPARRGDRVFDPADDAAPR